MTANAIAALVETELQKRAATRRNSASANQTTLIESAQRRFGDDIMAAYDAPDWAHEYPGFDFNALVWTGSMTLRGITIYTGLLGTLDYDDGVPYCAFYVTLGESEAAVKEAASDGMQGHRTHVPKADFYIAALAEYLEELEAHSARFEIAA